MDPLDPFSTKMFVGQGAEPIEGLLYHLEQHAPLLADDDRTFVMGCKVLLDGGGVITVGHKQKLVEIAGKLRATGHDVLGGVVDQPLSIVKVLQDLAQNIHTLNPREKAYANEIAKKIKTNEALTPKEVEGILQIYYNKGF